MVGHYRYNLGIDMGIASIGTALVLIDEEKNPQKILDMGVCLFSVPEGAAERRQKRLERKHIRRRRQRLAKVLRFLQEHGLLPTNKSTLQQCILKEPYTLRASLVTEKASCLDDLGRCFLHMAKFRGAGFLTQQEEEFAEAETEENNPQAPAKKDTQKSAGAYRFLEQAVREKGWTISQYFVALLQQKKPVRRRKFLVEKKEVEHAVPRFLVKEEFRRIWATQREFYPELDTALENAVYEAIFADNLHAPYAIGKCSLLPEEKRLPAMHRLAEKRRIYEQINNIRYVTPGGEFSLNLDARDALALLAFEQGETLNKTRIKKEITERTGSKVLSINLPGNDESKNTSVIKGFRHMTAFAAIPAWRGMSEAEQDAVIDFIANPVCNPDAPANEQRLYPEDAFLEKLCAMLHLEGVEGEQKASRVIANLPQGRSNLGLTATRAILDKLIAGIIKEDRWHPCTYREAADACSYEAEEELARKRQGTCSRLPYYGKILQHDVTDIHPWHKARATPEEQQYGRIPNPVVHVALNQLRKVVNEIVTLYGKPQSIHMEFARELGLSAKKRDELIEDMQKNERDNARINEELDKLGLPRSRKNRIKYALWEEQGKRSLYSCKEIKCTDLVVCELDHLIPQSHGGSDTRMNLCLVFADENFAKGDKFPYEMIQETAREKWQEINKIIRDPRFPKAKAWRFSPDAAERYKELGDEDQTDHRLSDTSYMAKMGKRYVWALCSDVVAVKGGATSRLRRLWGLDGLEYELFGLAVPEHMADAETGEVMLTNTGYPLRNPLWAGKPRIDHRHHALDALVAACTTRAMVSRLVLEEKNGKRHAEFPVPFGGCTADFRKQAFEALQRVIPSPKAEHATAGQLHDATKYWILQSKSSKKSSDGEFLIRYRRDLAKIENKKEVANILFNTNTIPLDIPVARSAYERCKVIVDAIEQRYPAAEKSLYAAQQEAAQSGKKSKNLTEEAIVREAISLAQEGHVVGATYPCLDYKSLVAINEELCFGHEPKNNCRMDFYETPQGKVGWECITRIDANSNTFVPAWKKEGSKLIWSLYKDDVIEVDPAAFRQRFGGICSYDKVYLVVQKMSKSKFQCNLLHDARSLDGRNSAIQGRTIKDNAYIRWDTGEKGLSTYCELGARKVTLSPFGKIRRKHARLWRGKKILKKTETSGAL